MTNRLAGASSAYLRQHRDNPVDWWPWGEEALEEARRLDRPIFLSIGYAACHWCHVMAHESFEDEAIARALNEQFISIKVDREERPDVDALYMAATQLVSGHGGWPMSVFLFADGRPFSAGTYYPPVDRGGQVGFARLVAALHDAWTNQRPLVEEQAARLAEAMGKELRVVDHLRPASDALDLSSIRRRLRDTLLERREADGGFGPAPKFPRPSLVEALLERDDDQARSAVTTTLAAMSRRGLYDHVGGGFARYSVDAIWHVPHFEKMLSDQALLARCYFRASALTRAREWRDVALDTLGFIERDLRVRDGWAASLDADAGGIEGSHVTWSVDEVRSVLADADQLDVADAVLHRWRIESPGAFEGRSIPRLAPDEPFLTPPRLAPALEALRASRRARVQPGRDEKVVLEWNAMVACAMLASGTATFETRALEQLASLERTHFAEGTWWRTEHHRAHATSSDLAWYVDASVDAFEVTGDAAWLERARHVATYLLAHYWDGAVPSVARPHDGGGLFVSSDESDDLLTRPKEIFDGATPSSHAVATRALARLGLCLGDAGSMVVAQRLVELATPLLLDHPAAVVDLVEAAGFALEGVEVVVPGAPGVWSRAVRSRAMPRTVVISGTDDLALLAGRREGLAYVCRGGVCATPARSLEELERQLRELSWHS